jgi:hypothetical protein
MTSRAVESPITTPRASSRPNRRLLVALAMICVLSVPAFLTGFLTDMDAYTQPADKLLRGGVLYHDTLDTKPPLILLHYALIFWLVGSTSLAAVKVVTIGILIASALILRRIHAALVPSSPNADLVALLFVLASFGGFGGDFLSSSTEIPANLFILLGVWGLVADDFAFRPGRLVLAGISLGVAFLYRYHAAAPLVAYGVLVVLLGRQLRSVMPRFAAVGAGFLVPLAALVAYFVAIGDLDDLLLHVKYVNFYMRGAEIHWPTASLRILTGVATLFQMLLLAGLEVADLVRRRLFSRQNVFLLLYLSFSLITFVLGSRFFGHYLIASIPPLALLAVARLSIPRDEQPASSFFRGIVRRYERYAIPCLAAQVALFFVANAAYFATRPPEPQYGNLARVVQAHTSREDRIFVWTTRTHLLLAVDRTYATRFISNDFLVGRMYGTRHRLPTATAESAWPAAVTELWPILMADLQDARPKLIVDDTPEDSAFTLDRYPPLRAFVARDYGPCVRTDGLCVYIRNAS